MHLPRQRRTASGTSPDDLVLQAPVERVAEVLDALPAVGLALRSVVRQADGSWRLCVTALD